jgi:DNA-binding SARP family transcriptional activator/lipopolysaccharide biosynthesis regulator YciM
VADGSRAAPRTRIWLLGAPRVEHEGKEIEVDTRKAIALLAYLAVTRRRHARDSLAGLLWPEYNQTRARAALRRTLSSLGAARAAGWLVADRESVDLLRDEIWVDVDSFRALLAECRTHGHSEGEVCSACLAPLSEAVALYRDDFLAGFSLRDSAAFDDWQFFQSEELRRELAGALERLSRGYSAREEWEQAIRHARRWIALDPLHEPAHRWLMQLYAWAGQRAGALRQYRECVRILEGELGVSPLEETTRIYEAIQENSLPPPPTLAGEGALQAEELAGEIAAEAPVRPHNDQLVGREVEWASLLGAYQAAGDAGHVVVLEGEAGIGKTRLAEAFLAYVAGRGSVTVAARCYPGETELAYGPFVEGLSGAIGGEDLAWRLEGIPGHFLAEASRLLPELAGLRPGLPSPPPLAAPGAQSRFFEGVCRVLLAVCEGPSPGVLFIDDAHWADASSLDLLAYLVRRLRPGLCVVLTWRGEQVPADHRLHGLVMEAQQARAATVLRLSRLSRAAVEELVRSVVGDEDGLGERLYDETEGLPLFVGEYLAAVASGSLAADEEAWSLPGGVRDLLHGRLGAVGETGWQVLNAAAVIGRSFDFDTVREASGRSEEEAVAAIEELTDRGLVEEVKGAGDRSPAYDFSHEKLRALVYEETSLARRRLLHRRVAEALARRAKRRRETGSLASQIAHHYRLAGQDAEAANYFRIAGKHARALYANRDALSHFRAALALGHPDAAKLHEAIGDLHTLLGDYGAALASYEASAALGEGDDLAGIERKLGSVYQRLGEWDLAGSHLEAALATQEGTDAAHLYADLALVAQHQGRDDLALERANRALELATGDERALTRAHNVLGVLASGRGDLEEARRHLERSLTLAEAAGDPAARVAALNNLALAYRNGGDLEQALERAEAALALCISLGDRHHEAALHNNLADLLHAAGRSEEAMQHLTHAVTIFAEVGEEGKLQPEIWKLAEW